MVHLLSLSLSMEQNDHLFNIIHYFNQFRVKLMVYSLNLQMGDSRIEY